MFYIISIVVSLALFFGLPKLFDSRKYRAWLSIACLLFFISWFLPSPHIDGMRTQFFTHFVGGGIFSGFLGAYIVRAKNLHITQWWHEAGMLFALVSSLGVVNELFELFLYLTGRMPFGIADTSWDFLANTLGALCFYGVYKLWFRI